MKLETVKSFTLIVLIGISILLSYTLWSYQPNSNRTLGGGVVDNEMDVGGSSEETKQSMIKPTEMIFHTQNSYYGFIDANERDSLFEDMQEWVITNFESNASEGNFATSNNGVELIFPDEIPMKIMNSLFKFGVDDVLLPDWSMNRIYISFIYESKSLQLDFISSENDHTSRAIINDTEAYDKLSTMTTNVDEATLRRYLAINQDTSPVYLPKGSISLPTYSITPIDINPVLFVNNLFANPTVVREINSESIGETYFTDSRQLSVYSDRIRMEYVNHTPPSTEEEIFITEVDILDKTITHINSHSGWTGDYRLNDINLQLRRTGFQLYYEGYPVFNNYNLSMIQESWGSYQNSLQLIEYDRPLFSFGIKLSQREVDDLPTGESVVDYLDNHTDVSLENIQDIKVGYELKYQRDDQESEYIELDPMWYKKENNIWQKIVFDEDSSPKGVE